jgi:hypothetical protein
MKEEIRRRILEASKAIPTGYLSDTVIKETIRCVLFEMLKEQGLIPVPAFRNPRYPEGPVDIVGVTIGAAGLPAIEMAFCSNPVIELEDVKKLDRVPCEKKMIVTFSRDKKKVDMTRFFLKTGVDHIHVHEETVRKDKKAG